MDSRICVYPAGETDYSTNGLGCIAPTKCSVHWEENGEYSLEIEHPIDDWGKYLRICAHDRTVVVPVPESPSMELRQLEGAQTVEIYIVTGGSVWLRTGPGTGYKKLRTRHRGDRMTVLSKPNSSWYEVTDPDGQHGYMSAKYLEKLSDSTVSAVVTEIRRDVMMRPQPFDIYAWEPGVNRVTAKARHVVYRLAENIICGPLKIEGKTAQQALDAVFAAAENQDHGFLWHCEDTEALSLEDEIQGKNLLDVILGDGGICETYGLKLLADWFDLFLVKDIGMERGVQIRYGKNLEEMSGGFDVSNVSTRIIPVGQTKDGKPLYLGDGAERYLLSPNEQLYARPRISYLNVSDAKVGGEVDGKKLTEAQTLERMRAAAQEQLDAGCDLPECSINAVMAQLRRDPAYTDYATLETICPGDALGLFVPEFDMALEIRVCAYSFDALSQRYDEITLGTPQANVSKTGISSRQLGGRSVSSSKLAYGAVGASALADDVISTRHVQADSINTQALQAESVTTEKLAAASVTADKLSAGSITADKIETGTLDAIILEAVSAKIGTADIDWANIDRLTAVIAELSSAEIGTADIDWAHIKDLATDTAIITQGVGGQLMISRLAVTEANLVSLTTGELVVKGEDGSFYAISVDADGNIVTTLKQIANSDVKDLSINAGEKLIEGTVTAACLNATDIFADSAVIRQLIAANLDVDTLFAREATVNLLRTMQIVGDKSIEIIAGQVEQNATDIAVNNIHTGTEPPETPVPDGKLWVDTAQDPNVIRRWLGQDVSTERDYTASASGNPVETPPGTASFDSIQSVLLPVQAGSGDPSPNNIRTISGWTGAKLTRCGKNLLPPAVEKTIVNNGVTFTSDGQGRYTINGTATGANVTAMIDLAEPITIGEIAPYCHLLNPVANTNISFSFIRPDGTQITWFTTSSVNRIAQIPLLAGETISKINLYLGKDKTADNFTLTPMFCIDDVPAVFAPYQGDTYAADFSQTVYGGTMDWTTGVLTVTHKYLEFDGTENWGMDSSGIWAGDNGNTFYIWLNGTELGISNDLITASSTYIPVRRNATDDWKDNCVAIAGGGASVNFIRTSYASVDDWIAYLADQYAAGTPVQIVYKLATPTTIQLPPATVTALKGVNTLHTDADSVSVAYTASGWEIVNDLSEINDVSNRLLAQQAAAQQAIDQLATAITVDSDGAHFYKPGYRAQNEVRIDQDSVDILVGGSVNSSFVAGGLILGNYMLWHPEASGGLAFNLI